MLLVLFFVFSEVLYTSSNINSKVPADMNIQIKQFMFANMHTYMVSGILN